MIRMKKIKIINKSYKNQVKLLISTLFTILGNKLRAEEQKKKEKAMKEEQRRAYGEILQLKQRQRAEVKLKFFLDLKTSPQWPS